MNLGGWCTVTEMMELGEQAQRMQAALSPVLVIGPDFLAGRRDADDMAHTMVQAVQEYVNSEQARERANVRPDEDPAPASASRADQELQAALAEIYTCGSGYLADRCDSDCVVRTMVQIMGEFGDLAPAR
jgi:uncharacterized protein YfaQ (DUF2300 family)